MSTIVVAPEGTAENTPASDAAPEVAAEVAEAAVAIAQIEADKEVAIEEIRAEAAVEQTEAHVEADIARSEAVAEAAEAVASEDNQWRTNMEGQLAELREGVSSIQATLTSASRNQPASPASPAPMPESHAVLIAEPQAAPPPPEPKKPKSKDRWI